MAKPNLTVAERFWSKVDVRSPNECWPWKASRHRHGYGRFGGGDGRDYLAHRFAWILTHGPIPGPAAKRRGPRKLCLGICHHCDNPPCCNPAHLYLGTQADNARDMEARGRTHRMLGAENRAAKLTPDIVRMIRASSEPSNALARRFGVTAVALGCARRRKTWKHVA